jgi:hypothetical protein
MWLPEQLDEFLHGLDSLRSEEGGTLAQIGGRGHVYAIVRTTH